MKIITKTIVYVISFWLISLASFIQGFAESPELCVVSSPLITPYFTPWLDTPRKARGCSTLLSTATATFFARLKQTNQSRPRPLKHDVHVITLHTIANPNSDLQTVKLNIIVEPMAQTNDTKVEVFDRLVLVLNSDRPVKWLIRTNIDDTDGEVVYKGTQSTIVLSGNSVVESNFNANVSHGTWTNKKSLHRFLKKTYKGVASYSEVKGANHVQLKIGARGNSLKECEINSQEESPVVTASLMVQLQTEGCFHEDYIGDNPMDVYVVELEGGSKNRNKRVGPHTLLPVMVQLLGEGTRPVPRNVTVVLKSHQPIKWQFGAKRIHGNIVVVSDRDDQVENSSVDGHERLEVRIQKLPDNMTELLLSVKSEYGPPIMYAKTTHASTLQMVVGAKNNKNGFRSAMESSVVSHVITDASRDSLSRKGLGREDGNGSNELMQQQPNLPPQPRHTGRQELSAIAQLTAAMKVHCGQKQFNITFPLAVIRRLGSPKLSLSDSSCVAQYNKTHATITSLTTGCGSTAYSDGKQFFNHVNVEFSSPVNTDDEDFEASGDAGDGSSKQIPITCKYQSFILPNLEGNSDIDLSGHEVSNSLYQMVVFMDKELKDPIIFQKKDAPVEVEFDKILYVKASIDGGAQVNVVTEQCWISNTSNSHQKSLVELIHNTCPADLSVKLQTDGQSSFGFFSFQMNREYRDSLIYLHCKLGVCTKDQLRVNSQNKNSMVCKDPQQYCSEGLRMFRDKTVSTAMQLSTRGPFKLVAKRSQAPVVTPAVVVAAPSPLPPSGSCERVVYVGIPTEVTIGIALLSFFMGVALTGTVFCIHIKTDPFRRQLGKQRSTASVGGSNGGTTASNG